MMCGTSCEDSLVSRDNRNRGSRFSVLPLAQAISLYLSLASCQACGREGGWGRGVKEGGMEGVGKGGEGGREGVRRGICLSFTLCPAYAGEDLMLCLQISHEC